MNTFTWYLREVIFHFQYLFPGHVLFSVVSFVAAVLINIWRNDFEKDYKKAISGKDWRKYTEEEIAQLKEKLDLLNTFFKYSTTLCKLFVFTLFVQYILIVFIPTTEVLDVILGIKDVKIIRR